MSTLGVYSEVGQLRKVLVHQPGWEHRRMVPWNREAMLFDDILDIESARPEHKEFVLRLRQQGVEVFYFNDLLKQVCADPAVHREVVDEVVFGELPEEVSAYDIQPSHLIIGYPERWTFDRPAILEPTVNLYFMRDPAFMIGDKFIISHPQRSIRHREAYLLRAVANRHPLFEDVDVYDGLLLDEEASIEGGDVLVPDDKTVIVGMSERSNDAGANHLARYLFENTTIERLLKVQIPKRHEFMHLDTLLTFVDRQQIVTMPLIWDRPELYGGIADRVRQQAGFLGTDYTGPPAAEIGKQLTMEVLHKDGTTSYYDNVLRGLTELELIVPEITVTVAGDRQRYKSEQEHILEALREQWNDGANTVAVKPGHVFSYARNDKTIQALEDVMVEVTAFSGGELVRGRGGARCMTMPLERDGI